MGGEKTISTERAPRDLEEKCPDLLLEGGAAGGGYEGELGLHGLWDVGHGRRLFVCSLGFQLDLGGSLV